MAIQKSTATSQRVRAGGATKSTADVGKVQKPLKKR